MYIYIRCMKRSMYTYVGLTSNFTASEARLTSVVNGITMSVCIYIYNNYIIHIIYIFKCTSIWSPGGPVQHANITDSMTQYNDINMQHTNVVQ